MTNVTASATKLAAQVNSTASSTDPFALINRAYDRHSASAGGAGSGKNNLAAGTDIAQDAAAQAYLRSMYPDFDEFLAQVKVGGDYRFEAKFDAKFAAKYKAPPPIERVSEYSDAAGGFHRKSVERVHLLTSSSGQKLFVSTGHDGVRVSALISKAILCSSDEFSCYDSALLEVGSAGSGDYLLACVGPCLAKDGESEEARQQSVGGRLNASCTVALYGLRVSGVANEVSLTLQQSLLTPSIAAGNAGANAHSCAFNGGLLAVGESNGCVSVFDVGSEGAPAVFSHQGHRRAVHAVRCYLHVYV